MLENVIVIGGGVAGLSAAIYLARAGLKPLVFAGSPPGGQLTLTSEIENYPGFESIMGADLVGRMRKQAQKFGARITDKNVKSVELVKSVKSVESVKTKSVLIATGAKAIWLDLESEKRLRGYGVSACATCDGFFFRDKIVAVVGGGDTALEEALNLTKFAKRVYIIHRRSSFRASKIMQDRVLKHPKIHEIYNAQITEVLGSQKAEGVKVKISPSNKELLKKSKEEVEKVAPEMLHMKVLSVDKEYIIGQFPVDGLFVAIGHKPDTELFKGQTEMDEKGYIFTTARIALENIKNQISQIRNLKLIIPKFNLNFASQTSVPGVFAAGDCVDYVCRQAATAAGMGVAAALETEKYLETIR